MSDFLTTWKRIVHDEHQAGTYWIMPNPETSRGGDAVDIDDMLKTRPVNRDAVEKIKARMLNEQEHPTHHDDEHTGEDQHPHTD